MPEKKTASAFLDDAPCLEESAFEIHERIADAIVDEIEHNTPGNIAVLGEWGSGKSTVLNYVKKKLPADTIFFTFDAWAHSGDTLRRSFIESLASAIVTAHEKGHSDKSMSTKQLNKLKDKAQNIADEMHGKETETTTNEHSALKPIPASLLIAAGFFVFFDTLLSALSSCIPIISDSDFTKFIPALSLLLAVACGGVAFYCINKRYKEGLSERACREINDIRSKGRISFFCNELAGFFSKQVSDTTVTTQTEYSSILDSCVFERLFNRALNLTDKTVVIAFDNLDRLDNSEILSVWRTLQIFSSQNAGVENGKRAWLILPITRDAFVELEGCSYKKSHEGDNQLASLSKLFIRNFEVPTPISTEWKEYFFAQTRIAFPAIDDETLAHVYATASRSLLSMELRTPRNAKRFLNSMVAESKVFPCMDLKSIAAYCYLRDAYNMEDKGENFIDYMIEVINGSAKESFYLQSSEIQNSDLRNDLAMMAFGQPSPEKASEVFVYAKINNAIAHGKNVDISKLVDGSPGSWETINRLIEDEIEGSAWEYTPSWVFRLLNSLNPDSFSFKPSDDVMRNKLAQTLLRGIAGIRESQLRGSGEVLARYLHTSNQNVVLHIEKCFVEELEALLRAAKEESKSGSDVRNAAVRFVYEAYPVFQSIYEHSEEARLSLVSSLESIDFGNIYEDLLSIAAEQSTQDYSKAWLIGHPPSSFGEACGALCGVRPFIEAGKLDYEGLSIVRETGLPGLDDISSDEIGYLKDELNISTNTADDWKLVVWILENLCDVRVSSLNVAVGNDDFDIEAYSGYTGGDPSPQKLAIVALAIENSLSLDVNDEENKVITQVFDDECIQFAGKMGFDFFTPLTVMAKDTSSVRTAKWMLGRYWGKKDFETRDIEECYAYAHIFNTPSECKKLGRELGRCRRTDELMEGDFCAGYSSIYFGALEEDGENVRFKEWNIAGFKVLLAEDWEKILSGGVSPNVFPLLEKASSEKQPLPNLDTCMVLIIKAGLSVEYDINDLPKIYRFDRDVINDGITSRFFASMRDTKAMVEAYGSLMHETDWFVGLSSSQKGEAVMRLINSKTGNCLEWLVEDLRSKENPKRFLRGHVRDAKKKLTHNISLELPQKYKDAAQELKVLLS